MKTFALDSLYHLISCCEYIVLHTCIGLISCHYSVFLFITLPHIFCGVSYNRTDYLRPAVLYHFYLDIFIHTYMGHLLWTLVNLRRGFSVGYFHVKFLSVPTRIQRGIFSCPVPERANADSAWDIFMSSRFLSLSMQNQRGIFSYQVSM